MTGIVREETIGPCRLIQGDCLEVLPGLVEADAVICDPPYGVGFKYNTHDDDPQSYLEFMRAIVANVNVLCPAGPRVFWQGMLNADRWHQWFPPGFRLFAACKGFVQFRPTPVQFAWDPVIFWGRPRGEPSVYLRDWHLQSLAPFGAGRARVDHPCPRPLEQVEYVVSLFAGDGDLVVDPCAGSGTTGVACVMTGRRFVGIEKDATYFDVMLSRIRQAWQDKCSEIKWDAPQPLRQLTLEPGE